MVQQELEFFKKPKISMKDRIYMVLKDHNSPLASHEFFGKNGIVTNDHTVNARLSELARAGKVASKFRKGKRYKEYYVL